MKKLRVPITAVALFMLAATLSLVGYAALAPLRAAGLQGAVASQVAVLVQEVQMDIMPTYAPVMYEPHSLPTIDTVPSHMYEVTVLDGQLVVYYAAHGEKARTRVNMVINTNVSALPDEELELLRAGIFANCQDELFQILQDYGS